MLRKTFIICTPLLLLALLFFLVNPLETKTQKETENVKEYSDAVGVFGLNLFKILQGNKSGENIFISPLSIEFALDMVMNGAKGETLEVMKKTLGLANLNEEDIDTAVRALLDTEANERANADSKVQIDIANSLWHDNGVVLLEEFLKKNEAFNAEIRALDFKAIESVKIINDWISGKTRGMIPSMIDRIARDIVLFAVNAIYFNGEWATAFDSRLNREAPFTLDNGSKENVTLMHRNGDFRCLAAENVSVVELPYGNGRYSMFIFLPKQGLKLTKFLSELTWEKCKSLLAGLTKQHGNVSIPIFKTSYGTVDLIPALNKLGMGKAFSSKANFTGISTLKNLAIGQVLHKAVIDVNEKGTEAAAATIVGIRMTSIQLDEFSFVADRPFAYIIMDNASHTPVFMGKLEKPEK